MTMIILTKWQMIYPKKKKKLQLQKVNASDSEPVFLDSNLSIYLMYNISTKICDKRDDFEVDIVNFLFLNDPLKLQPMMYIFLIVFVLPEHLVNSVTLINAFTYSTLTNMHE